MGAVALSRRGSCCYGDEWCCHGSGIIKVATGMNGAPCHGSGIIKVATGMNGVVTDLAS
jgi:hypothetical protein